jgi:carboxypeptidase Taq
MEQKLKQLKEILFQVYDLNAVQQLLNWDQQTYMPSGGAEERGEQLATLAQLAHERFTSPEVGQLLEDLQVFTDQLPPDSDEACLIRVTRRQYNKQTRLPASYVSEYAQVTTVAQTAWEQAKANDDFERFRPHLQRIVELRRQYAEFFAPYDHVYDPLLDDFEPDLKTAEVQQIFNSLKPEQVALIQAIASCPQVDDSFLHQPFDEKSQWEFGVEVITRFGYDWQRGRQDRSVHPFSTSFGLGDVRITTRLDPNWLAPALFGTMHECGHALYDQGISPTLRRTPLASGASMAIHESQSRLWENLVGRSRAFWTFFYPHLQKIFPQQLGNVDLNTFYRAINKVQPSLIRTEADEATYNLHVMLRLELEIALMEGNLEVQDLPEVWNSKMQEYLGIAPKTNREGVLQDIHWSFGGLGYFPTYALGNLISAQLWEAIMKDIPDLENQIEHGEFSALLSWLREKIHRHGMKFPPQELVQKVTGSTITPQPYLRYLKRKFSDIYGL